MKMIFVVTLMMLMIACDKGAKTPEGVLTKYMTDITSKKVDREYFAKYTSGKLLETVEALSDEEFIKFVDMSKIRNPQISISNKNCDGDKCSLTYIIKYDVVGGSTKQFESEVKKVATVEKDGEIWKISEVSNIKTYHESLVPINALDSAPAAE